MKSPGEMERPGRSLPPYIAGRLALAAIIVALALPTAAADDVAPSGLAPLRLPGIGTHDPRHRVAPDTAPWRALGKLQAVAGSFAISCTGTLVGPRLVLTAAHCLFNQRTAKFWPAAALHFLVGYNGETTAGQSIGVRYVIGPGYDPTRPLDTSGADWALLTIDQPLGAGDRMLPLLDHPLAVGAAVMTAGYNQDRRYVLMADTDCHILGVTADPAGRRLLRHDCAVTHGASGAPLLVQENGSWRIAGVAVMGERNGIGGYAVTLDAVKSHL